MSPAERVFYRFVNALMRLLLRSPLHAPASGSVLLLSFRGRRSGRSYTVPLGYVCDGRAFVCFTGPEWSAWWKNLRGGAPVKAWVRGRELHAGAWAFAEGEAVAAALGVFLRRFPGTAARYGVRLGPGGQPEASEVAAAVRRGRAVMILVRPDASKGETSAAGRG